MICTPPRYLPLEAVRCAMHVLDVSALTIFVETGLTPAWQQAFRDGRAKDPSYTRICTLSHWLLEKHPNALQQGLSMAEGAVNDV